MARLVFGLLPARPGDFGAVCVADVPAAAPPLLSQLRQKLLSDEALVEHLQSGRADALTVLFERHSPLLFAIARRILRNRAEAEDAMQCNRYFSMSFDPSSSLIRTRENSKPGS